MVSRDRTQELRQVYDLYKRQHLSESNGSMGGGSGPVTSYTVSSSPQPCSPTLRQEIVEFNTRAKQFSLNIASVSEDIGKLTRMMKHRGVFDDSSSASSLTAAIKERLQFLRNELQSLQELKQQNALGGWFEKSHGEVRQHREAVVNMLCDKLVSTSQDFKTALQQRTKEMADASLRRRQMLSDTPPRMPTIGMQTQHDRDNGAAQGVVEQGGGGLVSAQAQQMEASNSVYFQSRYDAVREIEAAVTEVGEMFNDFSRLVHQQNEMVVRIDQDVDTALGNVNAGTNELLRYLAAVSSYRGLIIKVLAVLFFFLMFFGFIVVR